jgi:hypothetical protein
MCWPLMKICGTVVRLERERISARLASSSITSISSNEAPFFSSRALARAQ